MLFVNFNSPQNPIETIISQKAAVRETSPQAVYVKKYLGNLGAAKIIVEQNYFDRDYLEEFSSFYSRSSRGYSNICCRVHYFSSTTIDQALFNQALSGDEAALQAMQDCYLGFTVIRPIPEAPFGRTVLKWYEDRLEESSPRIIEPARYYTSNIANIELKVKGLAWQQQDSAVAACATVGIWTMLHSSAFSERHAIPTTTTITVAAHKTDISGRNAFPSRGLTHVQILQAIKQMGFAPSMVAGGLRNRRFAKPDFASVCAAFIRSGYPLLISGFYKGTSVIGHAICAVGFRDAQIPDNLDSSKIYRQDEYIEVIYIHDDNVGPNVRMELTSQDIDGEQVCVLKMKAPDYLASDPLTSQIDCIEFIPDTIIAAVNSDLRTCPIELVNLGNTLTGFIHQNFNQARKNSNLEQVPLIYSTRFVQLTDYLKTELEGPLGGQVDVLARVRQSLIEDIPPMSLHLAVLRLATDQSYVLLDVIYDTTDSDKNRPVFGHVIYDSQFAKFLDDVRALIGDSLFEKYFGKPIIAF